MTPIECRSECSWWVDSATDSLLVTGGTEDNVFAEPGNQTRHVLCVCAYKGCARVLCYVLLFMKGWCSGMCPCGLWRCCLSTGRWTFEKASKGLLLPVAETACCTGTCFPRADTTCDPVVPHIPSVVVVGFALMPGVA